MNYNYTFNAQNNTLCQQADLMGHALRRCPFENQLVDETSFVISPQEYTQIVLQEFQSDPDRWAQIRQGKYKKNIKAENCTYEIVTQIQGLAYEYKKTNNFKKNKNYKNFVCDLIEQKRSDLLRTIDLRNARKKKEEELSTHFQGLLGPIDLNVKPLSSETFDSFEKLFDHLSDKLKKQFAESAGNTAAKFTTLVLISSGVYLSAMFLKDTIIWPLWRGFCTALKMVVTELPRSVYDFIKNFWGSEEQTHTQGYAEKNLVGLFALFASLATVPKVDFAAMMKIVANFKKTSENFRNFSDFIMESWSYAVKCVKYYILGDTKAFDIANDTDGVDRWLQEIADWQIKLDTKNLVFTKANYEAVQTLVVKGRMLTKAYALCAREYDNVKTAVKMGNDSLAKVVAAFSESPFDKCKLRPKPLTILFKGASGVGKSAMTVPFLDALLLRTFKTQAERDRFMANNMDFIYSRAAEQEYWDGYFGQKAVVLDDFMQADETKVNNGLVNEAFELIRSSNQFPYPLHKAHLEDKGNCYFESRIIMATTNNWNVKSQTIIEQEALVRRFDIIAEVYPKEQFCKPETLGGTMKDRRLKRMPTFTTDVYEFVVTVGDATIHTFNFEEMVNFAVTTYEELDRNGYSYLQSVTAMREDEKTKLDREDVYFDATYQQALNISDIDLIDTLAMINPSIDTIRMNILIWAIRLLRTHHIEPSQSTEYAHLVISTAILFSDWDEELFRLFTLNYLASVQGDNTMMAFYDAQIEVHLDNRLRQQGFNPLNIPRAMMVRNKLPNICKISLVQIEKTMNLLDKTGVKYNACSAYACLVFEINAIRPNSTYADTLRGLYIQRYNTPTWDKDAIRKLTSDIQEAEMYDFMEEFDRPTRQQGLEAEDIQREVDRAFSESSVSGIAEYDLASKDPLVKDAAYSFLKSFYKEKEAEAENTSKVEIIRVKFEILRKKVRETTNFFVKKISELSDKFPWLGWLTLVIGVLTASMFLYKVFKSSPSTEEQSIKFHKTVSSRGKPKANKIRMLRDIKMAMRQQGPVINERVEKMTDSIMNRNMFVILDRAGRKIGSTLAIYGTTFLINAHYKKIFDSYHKCDRDYELLLVPLNCWASGVLDGAMSISADIFDKRILREIEINSDAMLFDIGPVMRPVRDIRSNFITKEKLESYGGTLPLHVALVREDGGEPIVVYDNINSVKTMVKTSRGMREVFCYNIVTFDGECGSLSILNDGNANPMIVGIHSEGDNIRRGFPAIVTADLISELDQNTHIQGLGRDFSEHVDPLEDNATCYHAHGHKVVKILDKAPHLPRKTKLRSSVVSGCFGPPKKAPAELNVVDGVDPFDLAIERYATVNKLVPIWKVDAAQKEYLSQLQALQVNTKRLLTYEEAVEGIAGNAYINGIPRKTSAGYPICMETQNGKKDIFGSDGPYQFGNELEIRVREAVEDLICACAKGEDREVLYMDIMKDELRPIEKVKKLKTRMISCAPLHYVIAVRMYFGSFCAFMMENRIYSGSAVGVNPFSKDWADLVHYLHGISDNTIAGDFSSFDASQSSQLMNACLWIINKWYDDGNDHIRQMLFRDCTFSKHVHGVYVLAWTHCLPSGHPLTSICNTMFVNLAFRICWISHHDLVSSMAHFADNCRVVGYGDDHLVSISGEAKDSGFGYTTVTEYMSKLGLTYTDENKESIYSSEVKSIEECTFLKRGFLLEDGVWKAPLDIDTVLEMPYWYRSGTDVNRRMVDNIENCLRELAIHPEEVFDHYSRILLDAAYEHRDVLPMSFEPYSREFYAELAYGDWCDSEGDDFGSCQDADIFRSLSHGKPEETRDLGYADGPGLTR